MLNSLPDELVKKVFDHCSREDRAELCLVNKRFIALYRDSRKFAFEISGYSPIRFDAGIQRLLEGGIPFCFSELKISKLDLHKIMRGREYNLQIIESLESMTIEHCVISYGVLLKLAKLCTSIHLLSLTRIAFYQYGDEAWDSIFDVPPRKFHFTVPIMGVTCLPPYLISNLIDAISPPDALNTKVTVEWNSETISSDVYIAKYVDRIQMKERNRFTLYYFYRDWFKTLRDQGVRHGRRFEDYILIDSQGKPLGTEGGSELPQDVNEYFELHDPEGEDDEDEDDDEVD